MKNKIYGVITKTHWKGVACPWAQVADNDGQLLEATCGGFDPRMQVVVGTQVLIESVPNSLRGWKVTEVLANGTSTRPHNIGSTIPAQTKVRFFLPSKYFQAHRSGQHNGMSMDKCLGVLEKAFDLSTAESGALMRGQPDGFWITCRPSQFGNFIMYRMQTGINVNGIKDLQPGFLEPTATSTLVTHQDDLFDVYKVAKLAGTTPDTVRRLFKALSEDAGMPDTDVSTR